MAYVSKERLYLDADGKVVKDGDEGARTLLVGEGGELDDVTAKRHKLSGGDKAEAYDAVADHEARHAGETDAEADAARARMLAGKAATAPPATKAVSRAPDNKAG